MVGLPGEVVGEYVPLVHAAIGSENLWLAGYCNDVFGYIPTAQILREQGYETRGLYASGIGVFSPLVESVFLKRIIENRTNQAEGFPRHYPNFLPCGLWLAGCRRVDRLLRLESLQADWNDTPFLPRVSLPHVRRQEYNRTVTEAQAAMIREWAREDFDGFGYDPEAYPAAA